MSRSLKLTGRPPKHLFIDDPDTPADFNGRRYCKAWSDLWRCALPETDELHVPASELLPETPVEDRSDQILGEG